MKTKESMLQQAWFNSRTLSQIHIPTSAHANADYVKVFNRTKELRKRAAIHLKQVVDLIL